MSKTRSLYPPKQDEIMKKQLRISVLSLILLLLLTVGFFIFAINMATYGAV